MNNRKSEINRPDSSRIGLSGEWSESDGSSERSESESHRSDSSRIYNSSTEKRTEDSIAAKREAGTKDVLREPLSEMLHDLDHQMELSELGLDGMNSKSKAFVPIYRHDAAYAREHEERGQYRQSRKENVNCADAIEEAVSDNFDGTRLNADAAKSVVDRFGPERVAYVLANTVQLKDWDGRFSSKTKKWGGRIETVPDIDETGRDRREDFEVYSDPAALDRFIDLARKEIDAAAVAQDMPVHESLHDYLIEKGVDAIGDDDDFMSAEFDAVTDWCVDHDYNLSSDDEDEICARGLSNAVEDAKFNWEESDIEL